MQVIDHYNRARVLARLETQLLLASETALGLANQSDAFGADELLHALSEQLSDWAYRVKRMGE